MAADLVVDASGRAGRATRGLAERAGHRRARAARRTSTASTDSKPGAEPGPMTNPIAWQADFDGYLSLVFRHEKGLFSVLIVRRSDDTALRALRHEDAFEAAARAIPGLDVWTDPERAEPVTDVLAGGALLNVYRSQRDDERRPASCRGSSSSATASPRRPRSSAAASPRRCGSARRCSACSTTTPTTWPAPGTPSTTGAPTTMRPWVEDHIHMDAARVDRWNGADIDVDAPLPSDLILTAAEVRPEIMASRRRLPLDGGAARVAAGGRADRPRGVRRRLAPVVRARSDARRAGRDRGRVATQPQPA